ncbi:MAG: RluA family pseudouridine synthase [Pseudomonadota bacterium]
MTGVQTIKLGPEAEAQRLDRWLRHQYPHINQGRIEKMCRKGEIRLDGARVKASTRLGTGQRLRLPPLPVAEARAKSEARVSAADAEMLRDRVLYRDEHILALDKPAGLAVQGGSGQVRHLDGMRAALAFERSEGPRLVHRLDKDTSGVMVMARTGAAAAGLSEAFRSRATLKVYWAATAGVPRPASGEIVTGLVKAPGHGPNGAGEKMVSLHPSEVRATTDARRAVSQYEVIAPAARRAAWVALRPVTGRTHQLRVHMAELGCPIVGDGKYGTNRQTNEGDGWGAQLGGEISRKLHLHARSLHLRHPVTGRPLTLTAELPPHMARTWALFGWTPEEAPERPFSED